MKMRSGPKVSGRSRRVAADQGWSLRGVPLYTYGYKSQTVAIAICIGYPDPQCMGVNLA